MRGHFCEHMVNTAATFCCSRSYEHHIACTIVPIRGTYGQVCRSSGSFSAYSRRSEVVDSHRAHQQLFHIWRHLGYRRSRSCSQKVQPLASFSLQRCCKTPNATIASHQEELPAESHSTTVVHYHLWLAAGQLHAWLNVMEYCKLTAATP